MAATLAEAIALAQVNPMAYLSHPLNREELLQAVGAAWPYRFAINATYLGDVAYWEVFGFAPRPQDDWLVYVPKEEES